ncbi:MAG TPA: three-Cys-motif partner protein TcmP [Acidobacteriaceae bacterium]|nr:three-Cys-motif partner protein TcmP [Acidobacteriaceae bacterium]
MPTTSHELADDDGLTSPEVGRWAEEKYRLISLYAELFSKGMKDKWDKRVYIDLYAGAGFSRIRGTSIILRGSPALALAVSHPFDKYIFCEEDSDQLETLKFRTNRMAPDIDVSYVSGSCDEHAEDICSCIPRYSQGNTVLCLCLVDPFDFGIKFETIRKLAASFTDFLVLLAIGMDANRNYKHYVDGNSTKIDEALGNSEWRERWKNLGARRKEFRHFLAAEFSKSMESLDYLRQNLDQMKLVRSDDKNLPLYYLALFSRHPTANRFWKEVLKYGTDQPSFSWE